MPNPAPQSRTARKRAARRWYVYLILCRSNAIYTGIALDVAARYAQHLAGTGARYTRANPPRRLLTKFVCRNQSVAGKLEAAIKRLPAAEKRKLVGTTGAAARKLLSIEVACISKCSQFACIRATHTLTPAAQQNLVKGSASISLTASKHAGQYRPPIRML